MVILSRTAVGGSCVVAFRWVNAALVLPHALKVKLINVVFAWITAMEHTSAPRTRHRAKVVGVTPERRGQRGAAPRREVVSRFVRER